MKKTAFVKALTFAFLITVFCLLLVSCGGSEEVKWHYGKGTPKDSLEAEVGDFYLETKGCDVYTYTEDGWELSFNMKGADGNDGKNGKDGKKGKNGETWLSGEGKPSDTDGRNGDRYINTKTLTVYERREGKWHFETEFGDVTKYDYANDPDGLKILCIGNSYSKDTTNFVPEILKDLGIRNFRLVHLYIANCSAMRHYANLIGDPTIYPEKGVQNYQYRLHDGTKWTQINDYPSKDAIQSDNWDFILISHNSKEIINPNLDEVGYYKKVVGEVKKYQPDATYIWNMTWAGSESYTGNKQMEKYNEIVGYTPIYYSMGGDVSYFVPVGTAIQNARSSYLGDTMNRDGAHLSYGVGSYTAGLTFVGTVTGLDISKVEWRPTEDTATSDPITEDEQKIAIESAINALKTPLAVTESQYQTR